jgi:hypothetical protein
MKRSPCITLVLLSTLSLTACESNIPATRGQYASVADCLKDWGDPEECEQLGNNVLGPETYYDDDDHNHYYYSRRHGRKPMLTSSNAFYSKAVASNQSRAFASVPSSIKSGGFGKSGSSHGVSS